MLDTQLRKQPPAIDTLNAILGSQPWVLGDEFSVADVAVASYLLYVLLFFPDVSVAKWPHVAKYMETCALRPAYARAFGDDVAQVLAQRSRAGRRRRRSSAVSSEPPWRWWRHCAHAAVEGPDVSRLNTDDGVSAYGSSSATWQECYGCVVPVRRRRGVQLQMLMAAATHGEC